MVQSREVRYLAKWLDYDAVFSTWEPGSGVNHTNFRSYEEVKGIAAVDAEPYLHFPWMRRTLNKLMLSKKVYKLI